jgi:hypothetical protein
MTNPDIFKRVTAAYDLPRMQRTRIISIGCGGARSFLEDMARCGVGEFGLIDHDVVEEQNIATQQVFLEDIGRPKVDCIKERIMQINPDALVQTYRRSLDEFTDDDFDFFSSLPWVWESPCFVRMSDITLLVAMTDNFYAQARVNRLGLQFGLPTLCCMLYQYGQAGEITITYPGVTPACQRCILSPRYKSYLERGYQNTVTSEGAPIFACTLINALCGMIALALLHHGTDHPVWGQMLTRIGNRTLVQIRMHPDAPYKAFEKVLSGADTSRLFFGEAVWLPQEPDPKCPECGGTGDLRTAKGTFADTRIMPEQARHDPSDEIPSDVTW